MGVERHFLGWESPPLETGVAWFLARAKKLGPSVDMTGLAVCLPSARAGRLLLNLLAHEAERGGGALLAPTMYTPGSLLKVLLEAWGARSSPDATPLVRRLAWRAALDALPVEQRRALGGDVELDEAEPLAIASLIQRSHAKLVSLPGTFERAWQAGSGVHGGTLEPRLHALAEAERLYAQVLEKAGLRDPELEFARAAARGERIAFDPLPFEHLVLLGVADLAPSLRLLLRGAGGSDGNRESRSVHISALVCAPGLLADAFDGVGALDVAAWQSRQIELGDARLTVVDSADDLVHATLAIVGELGQLPGGTTADDVVLGVTDREVEPLLMRAAARCGVRVRPASSRDVLGSPAGVLLAQVRTLLQEPTFRSWGTLLRHGWFSASLRRLMPDSGPLPIDRLDRYVLEHLPDGLSHEWVKDPDAEALDGLLSETLNLLGAFAPVMDARTAALRKPLSAWAGEIDALLERLSPRARLQDDAESGQSSEMDIVRKSLEQMADVSRVASLDRVVTGESALSVCLTLLQEATSPPEELEGAIEAVGWLELAMDPARHVVVVGMNDGLVPSREAPDPLLPPPVLRAMGVDAGDARVARDAYLLSLLGASQRSLFLVASRRGVDGDPLLPSRLLFRVEDDVLVSRARQWVPKKHGVDALVPVPPARTTAAVSRFKPLAVARLGVPERWRVTAFKDYLQSPYLFYLRHVARVAELDEEKSEMLPNLFGSLVHDCLRDFAMSTERGSTEAEVIFQCVRTALSRRVVVLFGASPSVPVWLQTEQALARLEGFASKQAERAREGWAIVHAEWSPGKEGVPFAWEDGEVRLTGRIDRIDRHPTLGMALIDYKTADTAKKPKETHKKKSDWIDLQLPLYRHLAKSVLGDGATPTLAYFNLAADGKATLEAAAWDEAELRSADEKAREVIALVHAGVFGEAGTMPPTSKTFGALAGLGHLGELEEDEEDEA